MAVWAFAFQAAEFPHRVAACYCMERPLAESLAREDPTVVVGTVAQALGDRTRIVADGWFHGPFPADVLWVRGGTGSSSSCDLNIAHGQRRVFVLFGGPRAPGANGLYSTSICDPGGVIGTAAGDAVLAEAVEIFGEPLPLSVSTSILQIGSADGTLYIVAATAAGLAILAAAVLVGRRRRAA
jgi:hypothetical protein